VALPALYPIHFQRKEEETKIPFYYSYVIIFFFGRFYPCMSGYLFMYTTTTTTRNIKNRRALWKVLAHTNIEVRAGRKPKMQQQKSSLFFLL
jgi:hypothetical protein